MKGRVLLVTASTGIGAETARLAANAGARVFICSRTEANCVALVEELVRGGGEAAYFAQDLTQSGGAASAVTACVANFGRLDAVYNVAGISGRRYGDGPVHEATDEGLTATLNANVATMFAMCRESIRQMMTQEVSAENGLRGAILNMASVLGFSPEPRFFGTHAYAASKGAIIGMSRSMAAYYAPHKIRVNVIAPGLVATPMAQRAAEDESIVGFMRTKQPLVENLIDAKDVAKASLFLLSDDSRVITGDTLVVDAGWQFGW